MSAEAIDLLRSIDHSLKALLAIHQKSAPLPVASDRDLDGRYGNPQVKFMPRDWTGPSFVGRPMSECPADLLDLLAETFEYFARKSDEAGELTNKNKPVGDYKRQDAARARGWAKRIRDGKVPPPSDANETGAGWGDEQAQDWQ